MNLDITSDFKSFSIFKTPETLLQRIGNMLVRNIIARTQFRNVDPNDKKFKRYSKEYQEYKASRGGSRNIVNLKSVEPVGEHMVVSTGILNINNNTVEVGLSGINLKKAVYNEIMGRSFLGISKQDDKEMDKIIDDYIDDELKKM